MAWATTVEQKGEAPPLGGVRVMVVGGPEAGLVMRLETELLVGTSEACDLRLSDPKCSRRHLLLRRVAAGVRVVDQQSRNGTWVGRARMHDAELPPGTELRAGDTVLRIDEVSDEAPSEDGSTEQPASFGRFVGAARVLAPLYRRLEKVSASSATVLLEGESGTGKELLAEAIHDHSPRADQPFVILDCGAVQPQLVEARLFGHEKGAFTGADRARPGAFESAHGGTLFLDEVGELPLELQTRLLRALDRGQVVRLGSTKPIEVDVRVIAATNRDLDREVEEGRFRTDLFHRLAVVLLRVPPLRERDGDVARLARAFLRSYGADESLLTEDMIDRLERHRWPGNVRELRNYVERLAVLGETELGEAPSADGTGGRADPARSGLPFRQARAVALERFTAEYVEDMLRRHGDNVSAAARAAGLARRYFQQLKRRP